MRLPRTLHAPRPRRSRPQRPRTGAGGGNAAADRRLLLRGSPAKPIEVVQAEGSLLHTADGRRVIDLLMGWSVGQLGWNHPDIVRRMQAFDGPAYVWPHLQYASWTKLARRLCAIAPGRMASCFRATGGTEAVEYALQAAMAFTGRHRFVSLRGAYHGNSFLARTVGAGGDHLGRSKPAAQRMAPEFDEHRLRSLERKLGKGDVAAVILEPVPLNVGLHVPTKGFAAGLQRLCREHGTLLVADEVACGFGRTGRLFGSEHHGLRPDLVCLGKGVTAGHAALGATLATRKVADGVGEELASYSTFGWTPLAVEAALANLDVWARDGTRILRNAAARARQLREGLDPLGEALGGEVRSLGMAFILEAGATRTARRFVDGARGQGVLLNHSDASVEMFPALTLDEGLAAEALEGLAAAARQA